MTGENPFPLASEYNEDDIKQMAVKSSERLAQSIKLMETSDAWLTEAQETFEKMRDENRKMRDEITTINATLKSLRDWRTHVMKTDPSLNPYIDTALEKELETEQKTDPPMKKGLFEKLMGN